jgi:hypothetical protein
VRGDCLDRLGKDPNRRVDIRLGGDERRAEPDGLLAALENQQAAGEARPLDFLGELRVGKLNTDHQALAADVEDGLRVAIEQLAQAGHGLLTARGRVVDEPAHQQLDGRERGGTRDRVAAVR